MAQVDLGPKEVRRGIYINANSLLGSGQGLKIDEVPAPIANKMRRVPNASSLVGLENATDPISIEIEKFPLLELQKQRGLLFFKRKEILTLPEAVAVRIALPSIMHHENYWDHVLILNRYFDGLRYHFRSGTLPLEERDDYINIRRSPGGTFIEPGIPAAFYQVLDLLV